MILRKNIQDRLKLIKGCNLCIWIALTFCSSTEKFFLPFLGRQPCASHSPQLVGPLQKLLFINLFFQTHQFRCFAFLRKAETLTQGPSLQVSASKYPSVSYKEALFSSSLVESQRSHCSPVSIS